MKCISLRTVHLQSIHILTRALLYAVLLSMLPLTSVAQRRAKNAGKSTKKAAAATPAPAPHWGISTMVIDTTWMLASGRLLELGLDITMPTDSAGIVVKNVEQWFRTRYDALAADTSYADAGLLSFVSVAPTLSDHTISAAETTLVENVGKKRNKKRRSKAQKAAAPAFTDATPRHSLSVEVEIVYDTPDIMTLHYEESHYLPGSAGRHASAYATFDKRTGRQLTWTELVADKNRKRFAVLIANGLREYFGVSDLASVQSRLSVAASPAAQLPLPVGGPAVVSSGIYACYGEGEITHTQGESPLALIAASQARALLTARGRTLVR